MEYCDLLASLISDKIRAVKATTNGIVFNNPQTKLDLHPEDGYLLSTDKAITCVDNKGNSYKITIQANTAPKTMEEIIQEKNLRHSRNGDPVSFYIDSITTKLAFAQQDRSVLAEITPAELEVLNVEVNEAYAAKENKIGSF